MAFSRVITWLRSLRRQQWLFRTFQLCFVSVCAFFWFYLPAPGWAVALLGLGAAIMSIQEHMRLREKLIWITALCALLVIELRAITKDRIEQNRTFQGIADGIKTESAKSDLMLAGQATVLLNLQNLRDVKPTAANKQTLASAWGKVSQFKTKAVDGAVATSSQPGQIEHGKRYLSAESLGKALKNRAPSTATIINDGTVEAGSFSKQLEIGLKMAGWQVGGDNVKMGDPDFFPDGLTVEVSSSPVSTEDHSNKEAKAIIKELQAQGITATLRFTTLAFPANFMRIKVAGQ
jgi:hypothetical protein